MANLGWKLKFENFSWYNLFIINFVFRDFWLQTVKCALNDDYVDEQTDICYNQAVMEWWYGCWGDQCGTNLPEGICYEKCTPDLLEEVTKCDGMFLGFMPNFRNCVGDTHMRGPCSVGLSFSKSLKVFIL